MIEATDKESWEQMETNLCEIYKGLAKTYREYYYEHREGKRIALLELIETLWARVETMEDGEEDNGLEHFLNDI